MRPIKIARCGECDGQDGGDHLISTASSTMHDIRSPVISKDRDRLGSRGVTKTDDHPSVDARGTSECQISQDCNESDRNPDVKSDGKRHITPDDLRMEKGFIEDDCVSLSELGPQTSPLVTKEPARQKRLLDVGVSYCEQTYWRCNYCGGLNSPTARCGICRHFQVSKRETVLLERTRFELLNGRDFWICTVCEIAMPSLTAPCGGCRKMISFVPLELGEFEEFVRRRSAS
ncbi:hypothetical protein ACHAW5_001974 [Stephanodiscus triporus]|uniref:RanBP2-type domain-containing protein n=1 Tax=Stephanodiscus triporus TaxID=2934178 RepID=A0ABD3QRT3_9STRA